MAVLRRDQQKFVFVYLVLQTLIVWGGNCATTISAPLSLSEAERLAISNAPELQRLEATQKALEEKAIAEGQLPDPKLSLSADNVPTNSFDFTQEDMTMVGVGLQQSFPPGDSLAIKSKQTKTLALAEQRKLQEQTLMLLRNVRETWLDLYYLTNALHVVQQNQILYRRLLKVIESQYEVGKGVQSDFLQVQLELSRLDDQAIQIQQQIDVTRAQLGRWIGEEQADRPLTSFLPSWSAPLPLQTLTTSLYHHPLLEVDAATIEATRDEVALAHEQYKPGWMVDVRYGIRQGRMDNGKRRSNFLGVQLKTDLPLFTSNRQDKNLEASNYQLGAAKLDQQIHYRDLVKELTIQYAHWERLTQRDSLYHKRLVPDAEQNSKAALMAYQSAKTDLTSVLRAFSSELNIKLEQLQIKVSTAKARIALLYIEGATT